MFDRSPLLHIKLSLSLFLLHIADVRLQRLNAREIPALQGVCARKFERGRDRGRGRGGEKGDLEPDGRGGGGGTLCSTGGQGLKSPSTNKTERDRELFASSPSKRHSNRPRHAQALHKLAES